MLESKIAELTQAVIALTAKIDALTSTPVVTTSTPVVTTSTPVVTTSTPTPVVPEAQQPPLVEDEQLVIPEVTKDDLTKMLTNYSQKSPAFRNLVKPILKEYDAMKISDVNPKYYSTLQIRFYELAQEHGVV